MTLEFFKKKINSIYRITNYYSKINYFNNNTNIS